MRGIKQDKRMSDGEGRKTEMENSCNVRVTWGWRALKLTYTGVNNGGENSKVW